MNFKRTIMLLGLTLIFASLGLYTRQAMAAGCNGQTCHGKNPASMGCIAENHGNGRYISIPGGNIGFIENRRSPTNSCNAKWGRIFNQSGGNKYVAVTLYCNNTSNLCSGSGNGARGYVPTSWSTSVYTMMHPGWNTKTIVCGNVSDSGPLNLPVGFWTHTCLYSP